MLDAQVETLILVSNGPSISRKEESDSFINI